MHVHVRVHVCVCERVRVWGVCGGWGGVGVGVGALKHSWLSSPVDSPGPNSESPLSGWVFPHQLRQPRQALCPQSCPQPAWSGQSPLRLPRLS